MTGKIIHFPRHRSFHPAGFECEARSTQIIEAQLSRIAHLVKELEDLAFSSVACPRSTRARARASIERTRRVLGQLSRPERTLRRSEPDADGPQPEIDHEKLDRIYRDLDTSA